MNRPITADSMWTYENGTLKNKFNITDYETLNKKEIKVINKKILEIDIEDFSFESFLNLHKFLFEDLYEFAGKLRDENVVLDGVMLCQHQVIELCLLDLMKNFNMVIINSLEDMVSVLAYYYSELLVIYPFRDGNEITVWIFLEAFTKSKGYEITFGKLNNEALKEALIYSFYHNSSKLEKLFLENIKNKH